MMLLNNLIIRNRLKGKILRIERVKKGGKNQFLITRNRFEEFLLQILTMPFLKSITKFK